MKRDYQDTLSWIVNRVHKKTKIPKKDVLEVLGQIADLRWDWRKSRFDLYGLEIEETLHKFGEDRCPSDRIEDLS